MARVDLPLSGGPWRYLREPFPHVWATDVFDEGFAKSLEIAFFLIFDRGLSERLDRSRFSKNMQHSDAYGYDFPPDVDGPMALFYSRGWHDILADMFSVTATRDVNAALHHHHVMSANGGVHRDLGVGWFSPQPRPDGINPMDLSRCSYTRGTGAENTTGVPTVRAVTMIYYLGNSPWHPGIGGETGLYRNPDDNVVAPAVRVPPVNNSLVAFENTPASYHAFLCNRKQPRNSAVLWLHRSFESAAERWGERAIGWW